jgi:UDP-N-acetylmuramoylalanine--D-glutamate ligase
MDLEKKPVVVVGLARSGIAAARFLAGRGSAVVATDRKPQADLPEEALKLAEIGVRLELGGHRRESFAGAALVVVSPGVPWQTPELVAARAAGVPVIGELELGARHITGPVAAVTGTKGKSTTTAALGAMLREAGRDVRVGGNIGDAVTGLLEGATEQTAFVLEVSSFQLEATESLRPRVAVFLNLSADHLDRHASFEEYAAAKARIFSNQTEADFAVVNADDPLVMARARGTRARLVRFGAGGEAEAQFVGPEALLWMGGREDALFHRGDIKVPGEHIAMDLLAAATAARLMGTPVQAIRRAVASFQGIEHVLERVAVVGGVAFYNDTKATNVDAALKSIESFATPVLPILGGRYKGGDFATLAPALARHGKAVLAIGESGDRIAAALSATLPVAACGSLKEAVEEAFRRAAPGDTVLLAPGCSSFDMFTDYAARGRAFKDEVRALAAREGGNG